MTQKGRKNNPEFQVFIASPGDLTEEREIAFKVIKDLNETWGYSKYPAKLKCLSWEESAHAGAGKPQEVIKKQIPFDTLDIFIAILWKRLGTPTGTNRSQDNAPYLSGTQQEIEEAYEFWNRTGHPIIMLYRKMDPVLPVMSDEDTIQFKRVNDFLRQFEAGREYQALVKTFNANEFEKLVKRELALAVSELLEKRKEQRRLQRQEAEIRRKAKLALPEMNKVQSNNILLSPPIQASEKEKNTQEVVSSSIIVDEPEIARWLNNIGLKEHPFRYQNAEDDPFLSTYFSRFPELQTVTANDLTRERKIWIFFGKEGSGKTALRKFLAARGQPQNPKTDIFCIEYDQVKFEQLLSETDDIAEFRTNFIRSIFDMSLERLSKEHQNVSVIGKNAGRIYGNLPKLSIALRDGGIQWVLCLIDPGKESFTWKGSQVPTSVLLAPLLSFPEVGGVGFRYFLPLVVKDELHEMLSILPWNQYRLMRIEWDESALKNLISKRMTTLSIDQTAPYRSLGELCEDDNNLSSLVDAEIANLAVGNPRGAVWLANRLIEQHCQEFSPSDRISSETWDRVKLAWWARGESRILGVSEYDIFRMLGERIFYKNHEIVLQGRSDKLLKCLVQAKGGFRSKNELIEIGWPGENQAGITEKALSQAILRMKEELSKELKEKGIENPDWIKSVRGRGYRLRHPKLNTVSEERDNG